MGLFRSETALHCSAQGRAAQERSQPPALRPTRGRSWDWYMTWAAAGPMMQPMPRTPTTQQPRSRSASGTRSARERFRRSLLLLQAGTRFPGARWCRGLLLLLTLSMLASCRGRPLPEPVNLTLRQADDGRLYSFLDRRGKATIVYFFSTWCVPCQAMELFVGEAAREGRKEGIETVGVALDRDGTLVHPYVLATRPSYPVVLGGGTIAQGESPFGRIPELPAVIFLDGEGRPSAVMTGVANTQMLLERAREVAKR